MADELILKLDFERAPSAEDLGEIFSALARDYHEMSNGRTLVVIRVESGSIIATLTDAALAGVGAGFAVITAINTLAEFAKNLKKWFDYAKSHKDKKRLYHKTKKSPGQRSVEAIIKTAAATRSHVSVKYKSAKGETLEVELTPAEAIGVREQLPADDIKKARRKPTQRIPRSAPKIQRAIKQLEQVGAQNLSPTEIHAVVNVIVAVLEAAGAGYLLPQIALELEMRGFQSIAHAVRQHIHSSDGTHEPPLTTT
jgi:hypothetical protein